MREAARLVGLVPIAVVVALGVGFLLRWKLPVGGFLALQFPAGKDDLESLVGDRDDPRRAKTYRQLDIDTRIFIPVYWALLVAVAVVFAFRDRWWAPWVGGAAAAAATLAALLDLLENERTLRVLDTPLAETTDADARSIRSAAQKKWVAAILSVALIGALFVGKDMPEVATWLGRGYWAAAAAGVVGLVYRPLLGGFMLLTGVTVLAALVVLGFDIDDFPLDFFRY